jgi:metal-responsive CopG/Arc/MetJ family transcriptional regulator
MKTTKHSTTTTLVTSVRMPKDILDRVDIIAKERMWSRNQTILFLLSEQVDATTKGNRAEQSK